MNFEIPENARVEAKDIGGGLIALIVDGSMAHWNLNIPGRWVGPYSLNEVGSYICSYCEDRPGIYRLIGLDDNGKPASVDRTCGKDLTGTLYVGREAKTFAVRGRLSKLVRSLGEPTTYGNVVVRNTEHNAGLRLRRHSKLSERFPKSHLALTWCYSDRPELAEDCLLDAYFASFGDTPPLNRK